MRRARWQESRGDRPPRKIGSGITSERARRAWSEHPNRILSRKAHQLKRDLLDLRIVIRSIRLKLRVPERLENERATSRRSALAAYHKKSIRYNDRRNFLCTINRLKRNGTFDLGTQRHDQADFRRACRGYASADRRQYRHLVKRLRGRFEKATKGQSSRVVLGMVGCSLPDLRAHIERQFQPGMTWENWAFDGWHVDHIKPLAKFDLTDPEQQRQAFHFSNLQPLWAPDNLRKKDHWAPPVHVYVNTIKPRLIWHPDLKPLCLSTQPTTTPCGMSKSHTSGLTDRQSVRL